MFELCCNTKSFTNYEIKHDPKPIDLKAMDAIIKIFLWYAPNIESFQSEKCDVITDRLYENILFSYVMNKMNMVEKRDVKWLDSKEPFDDKDWKYFEDSICINCQKIIITRLKKLTKTNDLLRCLRNSIAHGHFALVDNYFIGFNMHQNQRSHEEIKKAIIKVKLGTLQDVIKDIISGNNIRILLLQFAFKQLGYKVHQGGWYMICKKIESNKQSEFILEKNGRWYVVEIISVLNNQKVTYLHKENLKGIFYGADQALQDKGEVLHGFDILFPDLYSALPELERVLIIDTFKVTKGVREEERKINHFRIIDRDQVQQLLQENPVDILQLTKK